MPVNRRGFLLGAAGGLTLAGVGGERMLARGRVGAVSQWGDRLGSALMTRHLGVEYLARFPDEADFEALAARLASTLSPMSQLTRTARSARLHQAMTRDFMEGAVVNMGGWLLSRTELRICALWAARVRAATGMSGVFPAQQNPGEAPFHWTAPTATFKVPTGLARLEFRLRSGAKSPQRVVALIDGRAAGEWVVSEAEWRPIQYLMPRRKSAFATLELRTTPAWKPANDFRTIGVAIDRDWDGSKS